MPLNLEDSDSSDDELLTQTPVVRKSKRKRNKFSNADFLDGCVKSSSKRMKDDARMDSIAETDDGKKADHIIKEVERIQREMSFGNSRQDTMNMLERYEDVDPEGILDHATRRALGEAIEAEKSHRLGLRSTIAFLPQMPVFRSRKEAMNSLQEELKLLSKAAPVIALYLKKNLELDQIDLLLRHPTLLYRVMQKKNVDKLPFALFRWMERVAQSRDLEEKTDNDQPSLCTLSKEAFKTLKFLGEKNFIGPRSSLSQQLSILKSWDGKESKVQNIGGLEYTLMSIDQLVKADNDTMTQEQATDAIFLITQLGMDPATQPVNDYNDLRFWISRALTSIIQNMAQHSGFDDWAAKTTKAIMNSARFDNLGDGPEESDDCQDQKAWCCRSAILSLLSPGKEVTNALGRFRALASLEGAHSCQSLNFDKALRVFVPSPDADSSSFVENLSPTPLVWKCLLAPHIAISSVNVADLDPAHINALCDCLFQTFFAGCDLLNGIPRHDTPLPLSYARILKEILDASEISRSRLLARLNSMSNNPFYRRANYAMSTIDSYVASYLRPIVLKRSGCDDDDGSPQATKQTTLDCFTTAINVSPP